MMKFVALALALASASAFKTPVTQRAASSTALNMGAESMEGISAPVGFFDPLGLAESGSDETLAWFRHAELKHGRVAMAAFTGAWIEGLGVRFPGDIDYHGTSFASIKGGLAGWDAVPTAGKIQMLIVIGMIEFASEFSKPHYMSGGMPGKIDCSNFPMLSRALWDPLGFTKGLSAEQRATKRLAELNNGRLAMIGVIGLMSAETVPGSVQIGRASCRERV